MAFWTDLNHTREVTGSSPVSPICYARPWYAFSGFFGSKRNIFTDDDTFYTSQATINSFQEE